VDGSRIAAVSVFFPNVATRTSPCALITTSRQVAEDRSAFD
jgi:hypothetical protein